MTNPFTSRTVGWITLASLIALSPQLVSCNLNAPSEQDQAAVTTSASPSENTDPAFHAEGSSVGSEQAAEGPSPKQAPDVVDTSPEKASEAKRLADSKGITPEVKRLVIASDVKEREPVEMADAKVKDPIVAFVELKNEANEESGVVVTFEHEGGKKVGFVELTVPAKSQRFRTWARTRNISEAGEWTAIVRTKTGDELARQTFQVTG